MRNLAVVAALAAGAVVVAPVQAQEDDPFMRSRDGAIECFMPDTAERTCRAMSRYRFEGQSIGNDAIVHIQNSPLVVMYASTTVYARDGMICGRRDQNEIRTARFTIDGAPADDETTQALRDLIQQVMDAMGDEICTHYTPASDGATVTGYVDGTERPELSERVIWVRPEDGYSIGAADAAPT